MSTSANGASDDMGPSTGYSLIFLITVICTFTVFICMSSLHAVAFVKDIHMHIYVVTNLLMLFFWIKLIIKIPKSLTLLMDSLSPVPPVDPPPRAKRESMAVGRVDPSMEQVGQHESEHARTDVPVWTASDGPSRGTDEPPAFCRRARSTMAPFRSPY